MKRTRGLAKHIGDFAARMAVTAVDLGEGGEAGAVRACWRCLTGLRSYRPTREVNRIRLLSDQVANQIAAGEVIERPASVVKELVENALDAEATRIQVEIGAGGRSLIRVTDDGWGMSKDDALLSLERHATSKLRQAEDLTTLATMGFRGEAIPSIASISRFSLTSREREDASGEATQILIQGGKMTDVRAAAGPPGTTVEVRQLFFNLPARRKFLRSEDTERAHIQHCLTLAALAYPAVGFTFTSDQRIVWQLPALKPAAGGVGGLHGALRERLRQLHGADTPMLEVDFATTFHEAYHPGDAIETEGGVTADSAKACFRVWGFIGSPGVSRSTREEQHLFVNRRPVENRGLNFALIEGYHNTLMKGRYPVCTLFLEIDPAAVDVNIHPAKREVKFRDEAGVRRWVAEAVRRTMQAFHSPPALSNSKGAGHTAAPPTSVQPLSHPSPEPHFQWVSSSSPSPSPSPPSPALGGRAPVTPRAPQSNEEIRPVALPSSNLSASGIVPSAPDNADARPPSATPETAAVPLSVPTLPPGTPVPLLHVPLRMVGVIGRLYVVLESDRGMVLMDQHAAHERVLYEEMLQRMESSENAPSQRLLLPETVELNPRDANFVRRNLDTLSRLGVGLSEFGERTFLLDALPPFVKGSNPKQFALGLIDELQAVGAGVNTLRLGEDVIAKTVCRHSVKANDPLKGLELDHLIARLRNCLMPYTCPHGRPTLIEMSWRELEKKFGRTG